MKRARLWRVNRNQTEQILRRIAQLDHDIGELERVRIEVAVSGTASATLSAGGGTKSFTRVDLDKLSTLIRVLRREMASLRARLSGGAFIRRIEFWRS